LHVGFNVCKNCAGCYAFTFKEQPGKDILIFGSPTVTQLLMQPDQINSYWVFINPVLFGQSIPLFPESTPKTKPELLAAKQFSNGETALNYTVVK